MLKKLASAVKPFDKESTEYQQYLQYLRNIQKVDDADLAHICIERDVALSENKKQNTIKTAINIYQTVSRS